MTTLQLANAADGTAAPVNAMREDEEREERRSGSDRRSGANSWLDPKTWVSILALLLTLSLAVLGYIANALASISTNVQAIVISNAQQGTEITALKQRVDKAEDAVEKLQESKEAEAKRQADYNYNLSTRLSRVEAQNGIK